MPLDNLYNNYKETNKKFIIPNKRLEMSSDDPQIYYYANFITIPRI